MLFYQPMARKLKSLQVPEVERECWKEIGRLHCREYASYCTKELEV